MFAGYNSLADEVRRALAVTCDTSNNAETATTGFVEQNLATGYPYPERQWKSDRVLFRIANRAWRLLGTAFSFATFGVGGVVAGLLLFPLLFLVIQNPEKRKRIVRRVVGYGFAGFIEMMRILGILSYEVHGRALIGLCDGHLIVANHPTLIDVVFLISMFPQADCVIKEAVTKNPFMRSTVAAAAYISNGEPDDLLDSCVASINQGNSLVLFPEGTRSIPGQALDFRLGAATIAVRTVAQILPITLTCEPWFLGKNDPWYKVPTERPHFIIRIQTPISTKELLQTTQDEREARHVVNQAMLARLQT